MHGYVSKPFCLLQGFVLHVKLLSPERAPTSTVRTEVTFFVFLQVRFMSLEKEVYPYMTKEGQLSAFDLEGKQNSNKNKNNNKQKRQ